MQKDKELINPWISKLIFIKKGLDRTTIEAKLGKLLGKEYGYNIYTQATHREETYILDDKWELHVQYEGGTPAPWVQEGGNLVHMPPEDSHVVDFEIRKIQK